MSSNSFAIAKSAAAKLKMKMKAVFSVALCNTAIQSCDRHSNRSFLLLRVADFVVDAVDVVDVSVSEIVRFPPGEHLACSGITYTPSVIVSSATLLSHKVFLSFRIRQRMELTLEMSFCPSFCTFLPKFADTELIDRNHCAKKHLNVSFIAESSGLLAILFDV